MRAVRLLWEFRDLFAVVVVVFLFLDVALFLLGVGRSEYGG